MHYLLYIVSYYFYKNFNVIIIGLGGTIYISKRLRLVLPEFVSNYFYDFLCIPFVLICCQKVVRLLRNDHDTKMPWIPCLIVTVIFCIYFEYYMPKTNPRYTSDIWDVGMYFLGFFFYMFTKNRVISNPIKNKAIL